ncbi:hypothetical protein AGOR_G00251000 [Albula goreensis]|uniref:Laminin EGF-like domain-containing protein n=1 Tax=Albula goreensis TaxID=1534307 RepID=A0A8T3CEJ9_9TELE|nr:hypothetical protein AGOR_G00251000 [Albula goreensis]
MKYRPVIMFVPPALELVLFVCTIGLSDTAPHINTKDASPGGRHHRAASVTTLTPLKTSIPNHLPEDKSGGSIARLTPAPSTTVAARTAGDSAQSPRAVTTTQTTTIASTLTLKTLHPITQIRDVATTTKATSETDLIHTTPTLLSTIGLSLDKIKRQTAGADLSERTTSSWSKADAAPPVITSTEIRQELVCNCSSEGVLDPDDCDEGTGQCSCLPGYVGLQCEDCEEGHFTNGSTGCLPCSCDSYGAVNQHCDSSGACVCKPGVFGPKCDDCHPGFFRFSSTGCQPCQCNSHSSYCHPQSGFCLDCQGNTKGPGCEDCIEGSYRRLGAALTEACLACPCSLATSTGSCSADSRGSADGLFRSNNSTCLPCDCNGNADTTATPRLCDPETGHCLSCTNHTAGPHCEICADGYAGDARSHSCIPTAVRVLPTPLHVTTTTTTTTTASTTPAGDIAVATSANSTVTVATTTTTAQALLTSPGSPTDNATATVSEVSWTQFNVAVLVVIIVAVILLAAGAGAAYSYREYRNRKLNAPFWTIELKEDNISFSSYHDSLPNADASGLLEDEPSEAAAPNGQLALSSCSPRNTYKP